MALLPWELYESLLETLEILADEQVMNALRKSAGDIKRGKSYTTEEVGSRLGL